MPRWADAGTTRRGPRTIQRGFSLLELVVVVILVALLFLFAFDRLMPLRGQAEGTQVASVTGALRSALGMEVAERIVSDGPGAIAELEGANPMTLLQEPPRGYLGERGAAGASDVPGGSWYFDPDRGTLHYRVRFPQYLEGKPEPPVELGWKIQLLYEDAGEDGGFDPDTDSLQGVTLAPTDEYQWAGLPRRLGQSISSDIGQANRPVGTPERDSADG